MTVDSRGADPPSGRRIAFDGGLWTLVGFSGAVAAMAVAAIVIGNAVSDVSFPAWIGPVAGTAKFGALAGIALLLLRVEDVHPGEIGLSRRLLGPALLAGFGLWAALNVVVAALAVALGNQWGLGLVLEMPVRWPDVPLALGISLAFDFLVVALVEEFVFRGYLQTKVIALLGDDSRARIGLGILTASVVFGILHTPAMIVQGASPSGIVGTAAFLGLSGLGFGILYELTQNVYFVALLHAVGNTWPLVADVWNWSGTGTVGALVAVLVVYFGVTFAYRSWALDTDRTPIVDRSDTSRSARSDSVDPSSA